MSILSPQLRAGRLRVACIEDAKAPRNLVIIAFDLDRSQPKADADRLLEAFQTLWQCVPDMLCDSSVFALHVEVQQPTPAHQPEEWEPLLIKSPLASIQLVHYVLGYHRKMADKATKQIPTQPTSRGWRSSTQSVLDMLARVTAAEALS